jgi:hypothetical protein
MSEAIQTSELYLDYYLQTIIDKLETELKVRIND